MDFHSLTTDALAAVARTLTDAADARVQSAVADATETAQRAAEWTLAEVRAEAEANLVRVRADADVAVAQARADAESALADARMQDGGVADRLREEAATEIARTQADAETKIAAIRAAAEVEIGALRSAADSAARTNASFGAMIDKLRNDRSQLAGENERLAAENAALSYERADILERAQASDRGPLLVRLRSAFVAIANATSLDDVLAAATSGLGNDTERAGGFAVRDNAIVYASRQGTAATDEEANLAELLRAHATLRIDRLAIELKATAELRAYAQMLIDEVEYVYDTDASAGKSDADRTARLAENLRCARQIYEQRVTLEGPAAATLLEEIIQRTAERKAAQPFGRAIGLARTSHSTNAIPIARAS